MMPLHIRRFQSRISYKAKKHNIFKRFLSFMLLILIGMSLYFYNSNFKPILTQLSVSKASSIGQLVINRAVEELVSRDEIIQNKITNFEKDENGQIVAVMPNFQLMNKLKSEIAIDIQNKLYDVDNAKIYIPIGNLTGIEFLSNIGPRVQVNLIPFGRAKVDFSSTFSEAGINQTRLEVCVTVKLDIGLLLPNNMSTSTKVETTIPMSETIIVGNVPESYTNVDSSPEELKGDVLDVAP